MNKYLVVFSEQNPIFEIECRNPSCSHKHSFNSNDVFKQSIFSFECLECNESTEINIDEFAKEFQQELNKNGITL